MRIFQTLTRRLRESTLPKYVVTLVIIVLMVGFMDENSLWNRRERTEEIASLKAEIEEMKAKYEEDTKKLNSLDEYDCVVRLAREKYLMHRPDEDVYVIRYISAQETGND